LIITQAKPKKYFFFEKKKQKTFILLVDAAGKQDTYRGEQKFFGSFFQKRTASFPLLKAKQ
jgi:hypothetical protein